MIVLPDASFTVTVTGIVVDATVEIGVVCATSVTVFGTPPSVNAIELA